ncbi:MAG: transposase [Planctomycetota bacterium]
MTFPKSCALRGAARRQEHGSEPAASISEGVGSATIETINGDLKDHRGLTRFRVRGIDRVTSVLLLSVLTYNLLRAIAVAPHIVLPPTG